MDNIREFVNGQRNNDHSLLFAITISQSGKHIGNIKIGPINRHHQHADISYFIGDKQYWNRGIASEAINLICRFGFDDLELRRIEAGCYAEAVGSRKALEKNGFVCEGRFREQVLCQGNCMDIYRYGLLKREFKEF